MPPLDRDNASAAAVALIPALLQTLHQPLVERSIRDLDEPPFSQTPGIEEKLRHG